MKKREEIVNEIVLRHGVQGGRILLRRAFAARKKVPWRATDVYPPQLDEYRAWVEDLLPIEADSVMEYAYHASSLAYRYLRAQNARRKKK